MTITKIEMGDKTNILRALTKYMHNKIENEFWMHKPIVFSKILRKNNWCIKRMIHNNTIKINMYTDIMHKLLNLKQGKMINYGIWHSQEIKRYTQHCKWLERKK